MSDKLKNRIDKIQELMEELSAEALKGVPIVVEGKKDVTSLHQLNVRGKIISSKTAGKSFLDILTEIEQQKVREVILLLDFDRRGVEWTRRLKQHLEKTKIKPNLNFWNELYGLVGHDSKDIEGLPAYLETLRKKTSD